MCAEIAKTACIAAIDFQIEIPCVVFFLFIFFPAEVIKRNAKDY